MRFMYGIEYSVECMFLYVEGGAVSRGGGVLNRSIFAFLRLVGALGLSLLYTLKFHGIYQRKNYCEWGCYSRCFCFYDGAVIVFIYQRKGIVWRWLLFYRLYRMYS